MTERQLRLLREVADGKWVYRCASRRPQDLEAFQEVADDLLRLEAMGYLRPCEALSETRTGRQYVDRVYVKGGVTEEGGQALLDAE